MATTPLLRAIQELSYRASELTSNLPPHEWTRFWTKVCDNLASFLTADTIAHIDDLLDRMWAKLTFGRRPIAEIRSLHKLLLTTAAGRDDEEITIVLTYFNQQVNLPRVQDRVGNINLLIKVHLLRNALDSGEKAEVVRAMRDQVALLLAVDPSSHPSISGLSIPF